MPISFDVIFSVIAIAVCFVLMGVGVISLAQQFVQGMIDRHERQHHRQEKRQTPPADGR